MPRLLSETQRGRIRAIFANPLTVVAEGKSDYIAPLFAYNSVFMRDVAARLMLYRALSIGYGSNITQTSVPTVAEAVLATNMSLLWRHYPSPLLGTKAFRDLADKLERDTLSRMRADIVSARLLFTNTVESSGFWWKVLSELGDKDYYATQTRVSRVIREMSRIDREDY